MPISLNARSTPTCAKPRGPPAASTTASGAGVASGAANDGASEPSTTSGSTLQPAMPSGNAASAVSRQSRRRIVIAAMVRKRVRRC